MKNENAIIGDTGFEAEDFDLEVLNALDNMTESDIELELNELSFLQEERDKIGNPDALGKIILNEVWNQFGNQLGLDMTNETLIQKYDREHPETYDEVGKKVMQDKNYKDANKAMKEKQMAGELKDEYTGKTIKKNESANLDHTVSRKEIYENQRRKQANLSTEKLANMDENLNPTNEALNKSKGAKSVDEYTATREEREKNLKKQNEAAKKKIDESNKSETEKKLAKEKADKSLQDKLDADDKKMKAADKKARKAIDTEIAKGAVKEVSKKAGKDALKAMAVSALFDLTSSQKDEFESVRNLHEQDKQLLTEQINSLNDTQEENKQNTSQALLKQNNLLNEQKAYFATKLKIAYAIAGGATAISLIHIVLSLVGLL